MTEIYTARQVADRMQMRGTDWLDRGVRRKELPHLRIGRAVRFTEEHVQQIAARFEVAARPAGSAASAEGTTTAVVAAEVFAVSRGSRRASRGRRTS